MLGKGCSQRAATFICRKAMQVLGILPVPKHMLESSGVKATVAERLTGHAKSSTRALAKQLLNCWDPKPASAPAALLELEPEPGGVWLEIAVHPSVLKGIRQGCMLLTCLL